MKYQKGRSLLKKIIFVTGTDTGVGKTVISAGLLAAFQKKGYKTLAIKAFQTGNQGLEGELLSSDALFYGEIGLQEEPPAVLNPVSLEPPAAPWVASILSKTPFDLNKVFHVVEAVLPRYDLVILEGAGGLCVPIQKDYLMADLVRELGCPLLIVARGSLGTINHTLLTVKYAQYQGIPILGVVINNLSQGNDPVAELNPWVIQELSGVPLLGVIPYSSSIDVDKREIGNLVGLVEENIDISGLEESIFGKSSTLG